MEMPLAGANSKEWLAYLRHRTREELGIKLPDKRLLEVLNLVEESIEETGADSVLFGELLEYEIEEITLSFRATGRMEAQAKTHGVPRLGEAIISALCPAKNVEGVLGDLEEGFGSLAARHGLRAAHRWYWGQVLRSVLPFAAQFVVRVATLWEALRKLGL
jgi:hypothetical protein